MATSTLNTPVRQTESPARRKSKGFPWGFVVRFIMLTCIGVFMLLPFLWQLLTSFKSDIDVNRGIWPHLWIPHNYIKVFEQIAFGRYYLNSVLISVWVTVLTVATSSMAAYAFSRLRWKGRDQLFLLYLATMMIPGVVLTIPNFWVMLNLHLYNTYAGLIIPGAFSAFGTFLLRQNMLSISPSLDEAAEIDGASEWMIFTDIILPLSRAGLIVLAIFTFMGSYVSFYWPLILIKDDALRTLPIGMLAFQTNYGPETNLMMAASLMSIIPLIVLFICMQKHIVKGIQLGGVKG